MTDSKTTAVQARTGAMFRTLAATSLLSTILLVMVGSFVRVTGYGLGCPDWPLCYGRAVPPFEIGAWVEFGHRLLGGITAVQVVALAWIGYREHRRDRWIWPAALAAVILLATQVVLGGVHVLNELPRWTGLIHTGMATAIVGLLALLVAVSNLTLSASSSRLDEMFDVGKMRKWTLIALASTYILVLSGSLVTRSGASLACPSFPLCGISDIPESLRTLVTIQMVHRIIALIVILVTSYILVLLLRNGRHERPLANVSYTLIGLLVIQIGMGISNVLLSLPLWSRILHLGAATAIFALIAILTVMFWQPSESIQLTAGTGVDLEHTKEPASEH